MSDSEAEAKVVEGEKEADDVAEADTEPTDLPCSGETYMSQPSHVLIKRVDNCKIVTSVIDDDAVESDSPEPKDNEQDAQGPKSANTTGINSSMEVEMNSPHQSSENVSTFESKPEVKDLPIKGADESQDDILTEGVDLASSGLKGKKTRKRKKRSADSSPVSKRSRQEKDLALDTSDTKPDLKVVKAEEIAVVNISSTPEKTIVLDDSQEFSLRIDDSASPPHKTSLDGESWKSHAGEKVNSPSVVCSQKSVNSWSSHNIEQNLSWSSHKGSEEAGAGAGDCEAKEAAGAGVVLVERLALCHVLFIDEKSNNKIISSAVKAISPIEEALAVAAPAHDKPSRLSTVSTTSQKSSSSSGSVGLPGPFPLPGHTRLSVMSTVSSSTSSSNGSRPAWDGPFLKPSAPGTKPLTTIVCGCCKAVIPPVEPQPSPIMNGSPKLSDEEVKEKVDTPRRPRKGNTQSLSASKLKSSDSSSKKSSSSEPQACSTPTPTRPRGRPRKNKLLKIPNGEEAKPAAKEKSGSAAKTAAVASLSVAKHVKTPAAASPSVKIHVAEDGETRSPVLAKWSDGRYYPGWASVRAGADQSVRVQFCDGQSKLMPVCKVVRAEVISAGCLALATNSDGEYEEILVVDVDTDSDDGMVRYRVERDSVTREVKFPSIALLDTQVAELTLTDDEKTKSSLNFSGVSLENILSHPRKRAVRPSWKELNAGSSGGRKKRRQETPEPTTSHGRVYEPEVTVDTDSSTHSSCNLNLRGNEMEPLDVECSPPEMPQESSKKLSGYKRSKILNFKSQKKRAETCEPEYVVSVNGPIPADDSRLFSDCVFLITYTDKVELTKLDVWTSALESCDPDKRLDDSILMWKDRFRTQIRSGGGKVYDTLNQVPEDELAHTYLVTDKPCNTPLYLQCLVYNIPIYSTSLIVQCCKQNLPWRELISQRSVKRMQAGYSLAKRSFVGARSGRPLAGKTLLLALSEPLGPLVPFWKDLIKKMGGVVHVYEEGEPFRVKYATIVTDPGCDEELVEQARECKVPLVSLVWLQQCIVNGKYCSPTELPLYRHDHVQSERPASPEY